MAATEKDDVSLVASGQLVGKGAMTEAERAEFLKKARADEASYSSKDYVRDNDPQHKFHDPDHPVNLKPRVESALARVEVLRENINAQLDSPFISFRLQESLKAYAATHTTLARNQTVLDSRLESRNVANQSASVAASADAETGQTSAKNNAKPAWHKTAEPYANYPLQLTESFQQTNASAKNASGTASTASTTFKPYVAPDNASPLYTDKAESQTSVSWHKKVEADAYKTPIPPDQIKRLSKYAVATMGLFAAVDTANATSGTMTDKLDAAGKVLKDQVIDAIPGVTYAKNMSAGKYEEARLDAAGYLPFGDAAGITRSLEAQAIIDALPKDRAALGKMLHDKTQAPINRHLAEYQLAFIEAKDKGDVSKGLMVSSHLTDLAEQKIVLQAQWKESAAHFTSAIKNPNTNWAQLAKNSDIAPQAAIHLAAVNSGYPAAFVEKMDATLAKNMAEGTPVSAEMMAITKAVQVSAAQPKVNTAEMAMAH